MKRVLVWLPIALALAAATGAAQRSLFTSVGGPLDVGRIAGHEGVDAASCSRCHSEQARLWRGSAHARAWTDRVFHAEHDRNPSTFCRNCHAPRAQGEVRGDAADGVDCASCHVRNGRVLGVGTRGNDAHRMQAEPTMREASFCAPCHQFRFPGGAREVAYDPADWLQTTVDEWRVSRAGRERRACITCHDPHSVPAWTAPMLARAVRVNVDARRHEGDVHVSARITPDRIGHSFPTGDMFRRAELVVEGSSSRSLVYQRFFAMMPSSRGSGFRLRPVDDARVHREGSTRELVVPDEAQNRLSYRLLLHRLNPRTAARRGLTPAETTIVVRAGAVSVR